MGSFDEGIILISTGLKEIQDAPTRRNHVVFVADPDRNYYAQFRCNGGDSFVYAELVSNTFLARADMLDQEQVDSLVRRGWDVGTKSNFYRTWSAESDSAREEIARELMGTFLKIYGVPGDASLSSTVTLGQSFPTAGRVNIDADQRNADWIKTLSWDLPTEKGAFLAAIGGSEQLDSFMELPAAEAMPQELAVQLGLTVPTPRSRGLHREASAEESKKVNGQRCEFCGRPSHGPGNYIPRTREEYARHGLLWTDEVITPEYNRKDISPPLLATLRRAFHESVTPRLRPDPTFDGGGRVYAFEADFVETVNDAVRVALGEDDAYFEDPQPFEVFSELVGGTDRTLIGFEVASMTSSDYGMNAAEILERGYLYLPGDLLADIPWDFIGAWEPAASREAFEHAFITNYVDYAKNEHDHTPLFEPAGWGGAIVSVGVSPHLLVEAMKVFLEAAPDAWWNVWDVIDRAPLPSPAVVTMRVSIPEDTASTVLRAIREDERGFKEMIAQAPDDDRRGVLGVYLNAWGTLGNERE
jgi:hypothetical protein